MRPWARAIKQSVVAREMPPYRYDKVGIQHLKGDLRLSDADIADDRALGRQRCAARQPGRYAAAA